MTPDPHDRRFAEPDMTELQIRDWIEACNHEPARRVLRQYLAFKEFGFAPAAAACPQALPAKRCDKCDNGIEPQWQHCAWCGHDIWNARA